MSSCCRESSAHNNSNARSRKGQNAHTGGHLRLPREAGPVGLLQVLEASGALLVAIMRTGVPLVFLEGSPHYYGMCGFEGAGAVGFRSPSLRIPEAAFQVARLSAHEPWMTGTFVYSEAFWAFDCVGLRDPED
ncbi:hypothetical protein [Streptomyces aureus]|uniref:hypothetical protein n=1 Tax=Streptomyces aureus TaxID=193461 RepID=UPI003F5D521C